MGLRDNLQNTATRLIGKFGDTIQTVTITVAADIDEFAPPSITATPTDIQAVVTGAGKWADGETILHSDLRVLVSGAFPTVEVGAKMTINEKQYTVKVRNDILATGVKSAVIYFVRR